MTVVIEVAEAKTRLSELLARVEAGEDIVIARDGKPIVRLTPIDERRRRLDAIEAVRAVRARAKPVTQEEIRAWRDEGRR